MPALLSSGFAPSMERRGKPRFSLHLLAERGPHVAAQTLSFSPGKLKLSCSNLIRGLKDKLAHSHTHTNMDKDRGRGKGRDNHDFPERRKRAQCSQHLRDPALATSREGEPQDLPPGCMEARALNIPGDFPGSQRTNAVMCLNHRASHHAGQATSRQGNGPHQLTGWAGGPDSSVSPWVQRR